MVPSKSVNTDVMNSAGMFGKSIKCVTSQLPPTEGMNFLHPRYPKRSNDQADRPAGTATITSGLRLGRSKVLRSLKHWKGLRETAIVNQSNIETVSKATLKCIIMGFSERTDRILNWLH